MLTVMKFGGTSVGSVEALERVANIVVGTEGNKVVVTSAMSGITNFLVACCEDLENQREETIEVFEKKHVCVAKAMLDEKQFAEFMEEFTPRMEAFKALLYDEKAAKSPYYQDNVTSQGERFSSLLLCHKIRSLGYKSVALTSEDCGIIAEGKPLNGNANLRMTETQMGINLMPYINKGYIPIITGFYGVTEDDLPLTFGRGGSDYAAAVVANALNADMLEIWTDVDGFMSADPRVVPHAKKIDEMSYGEAAELAYFGAKVLHPRTIEPVRKKHIPLKVRNSFKPEEKGTLISRYREYSNELLRSAAAKTDLSIITISSPEIAYRPDIVAKILAKISENDDSLYSISTSLSTVAFLIHNNDVKSTLSKLYEMDNTDVEKIDVTSDVALICCVGDDLISTSGVSGQIFSAVKEVDANVMMISEGASAVALNFVVRNCDVLPVIKILHERFVEEDEDYEEAE
ncbi:MAG: aspartate kinase [Methanomethylophilus sp.]|nr:aspartate kinase [Methanomethylophilus sp.]